jgi:hypothetical protein
MDTILLVQLQENTWERLDVFEDIPITLTIQQNDLTNLTSRIVPYSRTITLPSTNNNDILFEHYFEVNGIEFNPLQKIPCVVQYRGTDIFQGVLRLNSVTINSEETTYEIFILGEVSDFLAPLRNLQLQDLDYTDLNHILDYSSVTTSWECVNDGASGLFNGQIIYPLINYGLDYQGVSSGGTPTFSYDFGTATSFDNSARPVPPSMFKPAIQLKSLLDRMISVTGYELQSDFLNSEYFTSIYTDTFQNGKIGIEYASGVTNQNIFKANGALRTFNYTKDDRHTPVFNTQIGDGYDPLNNFINFGGTPATVSGEPGGGFSPAYFQAPYAGLYGWNIKFNVLAALSMYSPLFPGKIVVEAWKTTDLSTLGTLFFSSPPINLNQAILNPLAVNLFFDETLTAGEYIQIRILDLTANIPPFLSTQQRNYTILPYDDGTISTFESVWELYQSPTIITELVDMRLGIPNIECIEFLKTLITMFNLIIKQDETTRRIIIEPYNKEYNDTTRTVRDWTNILDLDSDTKIEPLSFELSKDVIYTYNFTDFEFLPREFYGRFDFVFGRQKFSSTSNLFTGEQIYEIPFGSCPTSGVTNAPNFIIPQFYYNNNNQQAPYATKPHLFFWVGNRLAYTDALKSQQGSWYLSSGATPIEWTTYPCVSHLSTLESKISEVISDLNFQSTFDFFGNSTNQIQQFTQFTLFNSFWRTYIENLYDPTGKRLSGSFYFRPIDVYETQLNDKIWIKDSYFSIEKITDADLVNKRLVQISLIKDITPYYEINPPAPIYVFSPNEGYPSPEPFYYDLAYISKDKDLVCNGTAPVQTFYSFGTGTLGNLDQVYLNTGTSYVLLEQGTYIRQLSSTTTFVCVDNYGRVLQTTC